MSMKYGQFCPIAKATEILGERWTILIIRELLLGTSRFSDFQRALSQISPTLLTQRLGQLVDHGLVIRKASPNGKRSEYFLTASGKELGPIISELAVWGMRWARGQMTDAELDVELLMHDICRRLDPALLPGGVTVLHFDFTGLEKFARWWIVVEEGRRELCVTPPGRDVDLCIHTDVRTLVEVYSGDVPVATVRREGRLTATGSAVLARSLSKWMPLSSVAHVRPASVS
jgi:DNA-binding HxlR family transcriptional regulator